MNVSSVKNLNGEVFSAVQDASLTNVVQTNSGNWQDITAYQNASASYLTAHQDLSDYYTTADANTLSSMLSGAIDYVSANAGDEFPVSADEAIQYVQTNSAGIDETVNEFQTNSSTYMVEPNLEYNAVNEISGYNGSAIAQYGAEKQWLVHDDTLVHASNSAQYALGVNLSALQRLMGIDETVLFDAVASHGVTGDVSLSESRDNFDHIRIIYRQNDGHNECKEVYNIDPNYNLTLNSFTLFQNFPINKISKYTISGNQITFVDGGEYTTAGWSTNKCINILQVIGIGRKS